jgi:hypothetical protein
MVRTSRGKKKSRGEKRENKRQTPRESKAPKEDPEMPPCYLDEFGEDGAAGNEHTALHSARAA